VNPACSVSVRLPGIDLVLEGEARRVTEASTLERVAAVYPYGRLARFGGRRRAHGPVQRAQRGPRALAPVPPHAAHRRRRGRRRAPRRHPPGTSPTKPAGPPPPASPSARQPQRSRHPLHAPMAPGRVLLGQPQHQRPELPVDGPAGSRPPADARHDRTNFTQRARHRYRPL
jgi:hypothetical protein